MSPRVAPGWSRGGTGISRFFDFEHCRLDRLDAIVLRRSDLVSSAFDLPVYDY